MENKFFSKKNIIILDVIIVAIILIVLAKIGVEKIIVKNEMKTAKHAVTINESVHMYSSPKEKKKYTSIEIGTNTFILKTMTDKEDVDWCKVIVNDKVGYIKAKDVGKYNPKYQKKDLMLDVSKFNMQNNFKTIGEFKAFVINNNIKFVYIRAGGRGYGQAGNFYTDPQADNFAEACEFLGIPFGYYFLDEAITIAEVDEEVKFIKEYIENRPYINNVLPVAIDVEKHAETGRADNIWDSRYTFVNDLVSKLEKENKKVILYSNANIASKYFENVQAKMWLAYYPGVKEIPDYWYSDTEGDGALNKNIITKMIGWQFTEKGVTSVIDKKVDLSIVYSNYLLHGSMKDVEDDIKQTNEMVFGPINSARRNEL